MIPELFKAILAMDAYNHGYDAKLVFSGSQIGDATINIDSSELGTVIVDQGFRGHKGSGDMLLI